MLLLEVRVRFIEPWWLKSRGGEIGSLFTFIIEPGEPDGGGVLLFTDRWGMLDAAAEGLPWFMLIS